MPTFQITSPDGKKYRVTGESAEGAYKALQQHLGGSPPKSEEAKQLDDYYSSGIYGGAYNPLGPIARSIDAASSAAQAAPTFGFGDEAAAAIASPGVSYDEALAGMRGREEARRDNNPIASTVGDIAGTTATLAPLAPILPSAQAATLTGRVGAGIAEGLGFGGLYGYGTGEGGAGNRAINAAVNGIVGGIVGGAIPAVATGARNVYEALTNRMAANRAAEAAGTTRPAINLLQTVMNADDTLGPAGQANMARAGQEAMLADAGPTARSLLDTSIQASGPGARIATQAVEGRANRGAQDLVNVLDQTLGTPEGVTSAQTSIRDAARPTLNDVYNGPNGAYSRPIDYSSQVGQELENIINTRVPASAINDANRLMRLNGEQSQQILARIADDGTVSFETLPDVRQIDYITRALRQAAESGEGQGALGGQTQLGSAYQNLARDIRSRLRQAVPEYGVALDTAADPISQVQAVKLGSRLLSPSQTMDDVATAVEGMGAAERRAVAQGIRSDIENRMANVTRAMTDGNMDAREAIKAVRDLSSRANRTKVAAAIGEDQANQLFDEIDRIATSFDLRASVAQNSRTFGRQATDAMVEEQLAPGIVGSLVDIEPKQAAKNLAAAVTGRTPQALSARKQEIYAELARLLTAPRDQAMTTFSAAMNYGNQSLANQLRGARIAELISASSPLAYPAAMQLTGKSP
ncbi:MULTISPECIES: hypothetical protein [unclassified Sinorhizobium]|uniref:hypothetical protein n=1 Tax=unclassified Sinorhizobium TaxID=2613772 RepID=UPI00352641FA